MHMMKCRMLYDMMMDIQMLMFGSASVAEAVCHLNRWDKCSLPVNALETAVELRQLDMLTFFLRSRDSGKSQIYISFYRFKKCV